MISKKEFIERVEAIRTASAVESVAYTISKDLYREVNQGISIVDMIEELNSDLGLDYHNEILEKFFWDKKFIGNYSKLYKKIKLFVEKDTTILWNLNKLRDLCHSDAVKAVGEIDTKPEQSQSTDNSDRIFSIVSEISEAIERERKGKQDDRFPNRSMVEVELADVVIMLMVYCGTYKYDIGGAVTDKLEYNRGRVAQKLRVAKFKIAGGRNR